MPRKIPRASKLRRVGTPKTKRQVTLAENHPAIKHSRTIYPSTLRDAHEVKNVLKSGENQRKLGKRVTKGWWKGFPIYALTLEERRTCPRSCEVFNVCYGNNMHLAQRMRAGKALEVALWAELGALNAAHPKGFVVRLHVLGDFYSVAYVKFWEQALDAFPALHCFGYTAWPLDVPIGRAVAELARDRWDRWAFRFSGLHGPLYGSVVVDHDDGRYLVCPAQTEKTECCGTCGFCWQSNKTIAFLKH